MRRIRTFGLAVVSAAVAAAISPALLQAQDGASTPPSIIIRHEPEYSAEAARARVQSTVVLSITVGADGKAHDVHVTSGAGFGLDEKAIEAVNSWVFQPATANGDPVPAPANVELNFTMLAKDPEDRSGQRAHLNFKLPDNATRPVLITGTLPANPAAHGDQSVKLHLLVDASGAPKNVTTVSSTDPTWGKQVLRVVQTWRFRPALENGTAVAVQGDFDISHSGDDEPDQMEVSQPDDGPDEGPAHHALTSVAVTGLTPRSNHTATLLANGTVLLAGGATPGEGSRELSAAQIFDPVTRGIANTGSMLTARQNHTATLLPDGKVLVVGGVANGRALAAAEIFDPSTGKFSAAGSLHEARQSHAAALLPGGRVLICGGSDTTGKVLDSAEIYDSRTGEFLPAGRMTTPRRAFQAVALKDGRVFLAGGDGTGGTAEIFDPDSGTFQAAGRLKTPRSGFSATLLESGKVLIAGGRGESGSGELASAELFDPGANVFRETGAMSGGRELHAAVRANSGKVLIAGGEDRSRGGTLAETEIYDPQTGTFSPGPLLTGLHTAHTATLLEDGSILVAGSSVADSGGSAELVVIR